ncbi:MAG: hypothetical protein HYU84_01000, partial [Chloroflexi bacterium]|nr:hypothetical protein [Chloroflexota bacterium]
MLRTSGSDELYPFFAFPWLTAATFIPMPWFITAAFDLESLGAAIVFFVWGAILAIVSEPALRFERIKKYALPTLLACMPSLALAVFIGFIHETWLGMTLALGTAILFTGLHILQTRWWLWALALLNAIITYFAFFELEFIQKLDIFFSYELVGVTILFLLPDLFLKKDWNHSPQWRLPLRMPGAAFLFITSITLLTQSQSGHVAVGFITFTLFCTAYALSYRNSYIGYLSAVYLPLAVVYALDAFNLDAWLPALSALAVLYYVVGFAIRRNETWAVMLRNSGMALGVILSVTALIAEKESGGWYTLLMGSLFIAEMRVRQNGWFEIGAPILFTSGAFLILRDFNVNQSHFHLLVYSLIWIFTDLLNHLTFPHSRPTNTIIRGIGGVMAVLNMITIPINAIALDATICYGTYTLAFVLCAFVYRKAWLGYIPAATLPLTIFFALNHFNADAWLPALTGLAVLYFIAGLAFRAKENWSLMLRNSALALGSIVSIAALVTLKETGGWYAFAAGLLFIAEMSLRKNGWLEPGAPVLFTIGVFLVLHDFKVERIPYHLLAYSLIWLSADLLAHLAFPNP